jgi:hypothetical protein
LQPGLAFGILAHIALIFFCGRAGSGLGRRSRLANRSFADEFFFVLARPVVPISFLRLMPVD